MIKFKGCGRCQSDVFFISDRRGVDVYCLQCGSRRFFTHEDMRDLTAKKVEDAQMDADVEEAA